MKILEISFQEHIIKRKKFTNANIIILYYFISWWDAVTRIENVSTTKSQKQCTDMHIEYMSCNRCRLIRYLCGCVMRMNVMRDATCIRGLNNVNNILESHELSWYILSVLFYSCWFLIFFKMDKWIVLQKNPS